MGRETIASVKETAKYLEKRMREEMAKVDTATFAASEAENRTREREKDLRAANRLIERQRSQLFLLRGYIEAKVPASEREDVMGEMACALEHGGEDGQERAAEYRVSNLVEEYPRFEE